MKKTFFIFCWVCLVCSWHIFLFLLFYVEGGCDLYYVQPLHSQLGPISFWCCGNQWYKLLLTLAVIVIKIKMTNMSNHEFYCVLDFNFYGLLWFSVKWLILQMMNNFVKQTHFSPLSLIALPLRDGKQHIALWDWQFQSCQLALLVSGETMKANCCVLVKFK